MTRYILVDIEAARGGTPFSGLMTEFAAVDLKSEKTFYGLLIDSTPHPDHSGLPVIADDYVEYDRKSIMQSFKTWLESFNERVVFISDNPGFDYMWIAYYFDSVDLSNPFGHSSRRIGDLYAGAMMATDGTWLNTQKWKKWRKTKHTHNSLDDTIGNAEALRHILEMYNQKF